MKAKKSLKLAFALLLVSGGLLSSCSSVPVGPTLPQNAGVAISGAKNVTVGKTIKLSADVSGGLKNIKWTSKNVDIAKVSEDGTVTGVAPGETTITANSADFSSVYDSVTIHVTKNKTFTVTFKNEDGTVLYTEDVQEGEKATYKGEEPTRLSSDTENYSFTKWDKDLSQPIEENTTFIAQYYATPIDFSQWLYQYSETYQGYLVAYGGDETDLTLPVSYNYRPVVGFLGVNGNTNLDTVTIPEGYTVIYDSAFANDTNLVEVNLPSTLKEIQRSAFSGSGISEISIPEGVTTFGSNVFSGCPNLTTVSLPSTLTSIPDYTFNNDGNLEKVNIPSSVTSIGKQAFFSCSKLTGDLVLPNGLTTIGDMAFFWTGYTKISIPSTLANLPSSGPFFGMRFIQEIALDSNSSTFALENGVLYSKDGTQLIWIPPMLKATSVKVKEGVQIVKAYAGYSLNVAEVTLPSTITEVENYAFADSVGLKKLTFTSSKDKHDITFGTWTLSRSKEMEELVLPEGITKIPDYFATDNTSLKKVNIPSSVKSIGYDAFGDCPLESLTLPDGLETLGGWAFSRTNITEVIIPDSVTTIGEHAFLKSAKLKSVKLPKNPNYIGFGAFEDCVSLDTLVGGMPLVGEDDDGEIAIPDFIFENTALTSFTIPSGYTKIGFGSFGNSKIETITIPASVTTIDTGAFGHTSLKTINYEGSEEQFKTIAINMDTNEYYGSNADGVNDKTVIHYNVKA